MFATFTSVSLHFGGLQKASPIRKLSTYMWLSPHKVSARELLRRPRSWRNLCSEQVVWGIYYDRGGGIYYDRGGGIYYGRQLLWPHGSCSSTGKECASCKGVHPGSHQQVLNFMRSKIIKIQPNRKFESWVGGLRIARIDPSRQGGIDETRAGLFLTKERPKYVFLVQKSLKITWFLYFLYFSIIPIFVLLFPLRGSHEM